MHFRDLFVLAFALASLAGCFAVVSATIQSLFSRESTPAPTTGSMVGATLMPDPVSVPAPAPAPPPALSGPAGVLWHPSIAVTPGGVAASNPRDLDEALLDEALLRQGIDPVAFRRMKLEAAIARFDASSEAREEESQPQDVEFWEVEPAPRHDPTV